MFTGSFYLSAQFSFLTTEQSLLFFFNFGHVFSVAAFALLTGHL